ncbi:13154_t:CDS:2 [Funneliformis geosporum]|uniref:9422_t:CDS:1 n=1 Tax=Funneliformis geosporum TaxID=1117311 RepID=A0A9W4SSI0_9GLOM|nr:9422_t:CDS:2 [Funneliformis geosporum]CAI2183488.1 13154_t:CDS:2 [Funneliformis geosporum]
MSVNKSPDNSFTDPWSYYVENDTENLTVHPYFKAVQARFWTFEHYINWLCNNVELPIWSTSVSQFYESLSTINKIKNAPLCVRAYVKSVLETMNEEENKHIMEDLEDTYLAILKEKQDKDLSKNLLHAQTNKKAYANSTVDNSKSQTKKKKFFREPKKRRTDNSDDEEAMEGSVLFDESNEDTLIDSIDESGLREEAVLPISETNPDTSKQEFLQSISEKFNKYQEKIPKTRRIITLGYWGIFDLTQQSLYGCTNFSQNEINKIAQDFANHVHWSPQPTPDYLQQYFDSCDPTKLKDNAMVEKIHTNIQFILYNMSKKGAKTEEEHKFITIYPLFNAFMDPSLIKDTWGETQTLCSKDMRNENANPFVKARMGRKVDMKGTLTRTSNKFEALYGEVANGLSSLGISLASQKKKYLDKVKLAVLMRDSLNSILKKWKYLNDEQRKKIIVYGWTLAENCHLPSNKDECALFEGAFCLLKELGRKLTDTEKLIQELHIANTRGKCRQITTKNSPTLNLNRTPN